MTAIRSSFQNYFSTTLSGAVTAGDLTFPVVDNGDLTSPCYIVIDPENDSKREIVFCDGTFGATTFVTTSVGNRGLSGSAAGAQAHSSGTPVVFVSIKQHFDDLHDRIDGVPTSADITTAINDHEAAPDPHPTYTTQAEVDSSITTHSGAVDPHGDRAYADSQDSAHVAAGDPHPQYQTQAESDARYLGISAKAADSNLLDGLDSTAFLRANTSDSFTSGTLTFSVGTTVDVNGTLDAAGATAVTVPNSTGSTNALNTGTADARYLGIAAKAADSQLLDGVDSLSFLRADQSDTFSSGTLTMGAGTTLAAANATAVTVPASTTSTHALRVGTADSRYLGISAKAADSNLLDGLDSTAFVRVNGSTPFTANQSMGGFKITNLGTPTVGTDAVTKDYADALVAGGGDHGTLAGLGDDDHPQYLRSDATDSYTSGTLTFSAGTTLDTGAATAVIVPSSTSSTHALNVTTADGRYLGAAAKAADSDLLDGLDQSAFLRKVGGATHGLMSGDLYLQDNQLIRAYMRDTAEVVDTEAISGAAYTLDHNLANVHDVTLTAACTITFSNPPASGRAGTLTLILRQDATGSRTVVWPASVDWPDGTEPTLSTAANAVDVFTFLTVDGGTTWLGFIGGQAFA